MQRAPPAEGCVHGTPWGQWSVAGEAVLRKAVCSRGELPAGIILRCCLEQELPGPGWPQSVQAWGSPAVPLPSRDGRWVCVASQKAVLAMLAGAKILGRLSRVSSSRR